MANVLVENLSLGPVAPFDAAATVLTVGGFIIAWTWSENYGDASASSSTTDGFKKAAQLIWNGETAGNWPAALLTGAPASGFVFGGQPPSHSKPSQMQPISCQHTATPLLHLPHSLPPSLQSPRLRCWVRCSRCSRPPCTPLSSCGPPRSGVPWSQRNIAQQCICNIAVHLQYLDMLSRQFGLCPLSSSVSLRCLIE